MWKVKVTGIHIVRKKLRDGSVAEYHYAWRGGPRVEGEPGSAAYLASLASARLDHRAGGAKTMAGLVAGYKKSAEYGRLRPVTQAQYAKLLDRVVDRFGAMTVEELEAPKARADFLEWRDSMMATPRKADLCMTLLKLVLGWAEDRAMIKVNRARGAKRLAKRDRSGSIWTVGELDRLDEVASKELWWAVLLALHTGIRRGDLIELKWADVGERTIDFVSSKTGKKVVVPITRECRAVLEGIREERRAGAHVLTSSWKRPWSSAGLAEAMDQAKKKSGVKKTFHDLRRTYATELLKKGLSESQVALMMGWEESDVEAMKRTYVSREAVVSAILEKLEG